MSSAISEKYEELDLGFELDMEFELHQVMGLEEQEELDVEWIYLLLEAKQLGVTPQEVREFLHVE